MTKRQDNQDSRDWSRRDLLVAVATAGAATTGGLLAAQGSTGAAALGSESRSSGSVETSLGRTGGVRLPTLFMPHGGGPWPFVDLGPLVAPEESEVLASYLRDVPSGLPVRPRAMVVVSAHWEEPVPTVMVNPRPPMLYDYYGFPKASYEIQWPAPGAPAVAARVRELLEGAGIQAAEDAARGFDHGTFVPLKVAFPKADVPTIQLSLKRGLDPAEHLAMGRALAPLRDEGILLVGSGMSFHDLRGFGSGRARVHAEAFDAWLQQVAVLDAAERDRALEEWSSAPSARQAHPREEHLLPLMVVAGAAGADRGRVPHSATFGGMRISAVHFGA